MINYSRFLIIYKSINEIRSVFGLRSATLRSFFLGRFDIVIIIVAVRTQLINFFVVFFYEFYWAFRRHQQKPESEYCQTGNVFEIDTTVTPEDGQQYSIFNKISINANENMRTDVLRSKVKPKKKKIVPKKIRHCHKSINSHKTNPGSARLVHTLAQTIRPRVQGKPDPLVHSDRSSSCLELSHTK